MPLKVVFTKAKAAQVARAAKIAATKARNAILAA
jgi:hypothetical protein